MPSRPPPVASAEKWLVVAKGDLAIAERPREPDVPWELLGFHAQQAAEKAIKAVLVHHGIRPPRTHDITELLSILRQKSLSSPPGEEGLPRLTLWAVEARYPGAGFKDATEEDLRRAVEMARAVLAWADAEVSRKTQ